MSGSAAVEDEGASEGVSGLDGVGGSWGRGCGRGSTWGVMKGPGSLGCGVEGMLVIDLEDDRSRFKGGAGVGAAIDVFLAEPGRGGGCMGVCFGFDTREEPVRASVGV